MKDRCVSTARPNCLRTTHEPPQRGATQRDSRHRDRPAADRRITWEREQPDTSKFADKIATDLDLDLEGVRMSAKRTDVEIVSWSGTKHWAAQISGRNVYEGKNYYFAACSSLNTGWARWQTAIDRQAATWIAPKFNDAPWCKRCLKLNDQEPV
jgi:hypothetical protein